MATLAQLQTNLTEVQTALAESRSATTASTDVIQVVDSTITGYTEKCDQGVSETWQTVNCSTLVMNSSLAWITSIQQITRSAEVHRGEDFDKEFRFSGCNGLDQPVGHFL